MTLLVCVGAWIVMAKLEVSFSSKQRVPQVTLTWCLLISQPYKSDDFGFIVLEGPLWQLV